MRATLSKIVMNWWRGLKGKIKIQEPMKKHTTFKIGGPAKLFIEPPDTRSLRLLLNSLNPVRKIHTGKTKFSNGVKRYLPTGRKSKIPILIIGAGSNILINDKGLKAVVLRLNSPAFKKIFFEHNHLNVGSGVMLNRILRMAQRRGLSGLEFLAGIPGTVGGALVMNAGIPQDNIGDLVEQVSVMDYNGNIKTLKKGEIKFGYRTSSLSKYIILNARLKLVKKDKKEIKDKINRYINYRKLTQDLSRPSAGCIFKNPKGVSAGALIDLCGLKGKRIGDACISPRHANFILNLGEARSDDVLRLIDLIRKKVKKEFNITLKPEIKIWQ